MTRNGDVTPMILKRSSGASNVFVIYHMSANTFTHRRPFAFRDEAIEGTISGQSLTHNNIPTSTALCRIDGTAVPEAIYGESKEDDNILRRNINVPILFCPEDKPSVMFDPCISTGQVGVAHVPKVLGTGIPRKRKRGFC